MDQQNANEVDLDFQEEIFDDNQQQSKEEFEFDCIVGLMEEILISEEFEELQNEFLREKCKDFQESDENKPEYILHFKDYQKTLETYIEKQLTDQFPSFTMKQFSEQLQCRQDQIDEQILETLISFSDFELFKDIMIEQKRRVEEEERTIKKKSIKAQKGQKKTLNNGNIFSVQPQQSQQSWQQKNQKKQQHVHQEEEEIVNDQYFIPQKEEGDLRPDLFFCVRPLPTPKITRKQ